MASQHHHREALLKSHHGALAHQQMADASWRIRTRGRAGEARASGLDAGTFTHRRRKSGTEGGRLKINSDEFIQKRPETKRPGGRGSDWPSRRCVKLRKLQLSAEEVKTFNTYFKIPNYVIFFIVFVDPVYFLFLILYGNFKGSSVRKAVYFNK